MRRLEQGVHFGMESAAEFVTFPWRHLELFPQTANIQTVLKPARRSVIACRQDVFIHHQHCPYLTP
jgi:hypothetical protein